MLLAQDRLVILCNGLATHRSSSLPPQQETGLESQQGRCLKEHFALEFFYESQYGKWSDIAIYVGCLFPIGKHPEFNPYYEHENSTGKRPNQQLNQLGLMLNLYFSVRKSDLAIGGHRESQPHQRRIQ